MKNYSRLITVVALGVTVCFFAGCKIESNNLSEKPSVSIPGKVNVTEEPKETAENPVSVQRTINNTDKFANKTQTYILQDNGLVVTIDFYPEHYGFMGTLQNITTKTISVSQLEVKYENGSHSTSVYGIAVEPNQTASFIVKLTGSIDEFERWRPSVTIMDDGGEDGNFKEPQILIKD